MADEIVEKTEEEIHDESKIESVDEESEELIVSTANDDEESQNDESQVTSDSYEVIEKPADEVAKKKPLGDDSSENEDVDVIDQVPNEGDANAEENNDTLKQGEQTSLLDEQQASLNDNQDQQEVGHVVEDQQEDTKDTEKQNTCEPEEKEILGENTPLLSERNNDIAPVDPVVLKIDSVLWSVRAKYDQMQSVIGIVKDEHSIIWPGPLRFFYTFVAGLALIFNGSFFYSLLATIEVNKWCKFTEKCRNFARDISASSSKKSDGKFSITSIDPVIVRRFIVECFKAYFLLLAVLRQEQFPIARAVVLGVAVSLQLSPILQLVGKEKIPKKFNFMGEKFQIHLITLVLTFVLQFVFLISGMGPFFHAFGLGVEYVMQCVLLAMGSHLPTTLKDEMHEEFSKKKRIIVGSSVFGIVAIGFMSRYLFSASLSVFVKLFALPFFVADNAINFFFMPWN